MNKIEGAASEVIEKSEWVAFATTGADGPHLAVCWTQSVLALGMDGNEILFPDGRYEKTNENLRRDPRIELLFVTRDVKRAKGQGQGCTVISTGELQATGP